ncbi:hypothetical protein [Actinophytocola sediminis]
MAKKKAPAWDSRAMQRAISKHDKKYAKAHGLPRPPKPPKRSRSCLPVVLVQPAVPTVAALAAAKGWG